MSGGVYGGEEVGAVIVDIGNNTTKIGFAGEDCPKHDIPSNIGVNIDEKSGVKSYAFGTERLVVPKEGKEVTGFMKDGGIDDWDAFEKYMSFAWKNCLHSESSEHPILISEPSWNIKHQREKLLELIFEKFRAPAFFICKQAVLAAFASGRPTALILDSGHSHTTATPVFEGYILKTCTVTSPLGGDFVMNQCRKLLEDLNCDVTPIYKIAKKDFVSVGQPAQWSQKNLPPVTKSYDDYMNRLLLQDFVSTTLNTSEQELDVEAADLLPTLTYEFPNGYNRLFASERFKIPEMLFNTTCIPNSSSTSLGMSQVLTTSLSMCDVDIRSHLSTNIVVVGGNSLMHGLVDRLNRDLLPRTSSGMKFKVNADNRTIERKFASWIGGSILGSLGTFHQMWISAQEYQETGKSILDKKCS